MFDINALQPVTTMNPRNNYDLRISLKTEKITLSAAAIARLGLANKGMTMYAPMNGEVIVSVQDEENSVFFKGREGAENKTPTFTASALFNALKATGSTQFELNHLQSADGVDYYAVVGMDGNSVTDSEQVDEVSEEGIVGEPVAEEDSVETEEELSFG